MQQDRGDEEVAFLRLDRLAVDRERHDRARSARSTAGTAPPRHRTLESRARDRRLTVRLGIVLTDAAHQTTLAPIAHRGPSDENRAAPTSISSTAGKLHPVIVELVTDEGVDRHRRGGDRLRDRRHRGGRHGQGPRRAHDRRPRSVAHRGAVVGDVRPLLLGEGRRRHRLRRHQRHRAGAVGHQGQGARRTRLRAPRRPDARQGAGLRQRLVRRRAHAGASSRRRRSGRCATVTTR